MHRHHHVHRRHHICLCISIWKSNQTSHIYTCICMCRFFPPRLFTLQVPRHDVQGFEQAVGQPPRGGASRGSVPSYHYTSAAILFDGDNTCGDVGVGGELSMRWHVKASPPSRNTSPTCYVYLALVGMIGPACRPSHPSRQIDPRRNACHACIASHR